MSLVQNLTGRRLQELGQKIEARGFAGPVWTDQRMNAAAANPKIDIANSEESRKFLGQSVGFENELIGQSNFPRQPKPRPSRVANFFLTGRFRTPWKIPSRTGRLRARICLQRPAMRKVQSWASVGSRR